MQVLVENTSTLGRRLKISIPKGTVKSHINEQMAKLAKEVRLKGFRQGKVPQQVLQQKFGESVRLEVIDKLIRESLTDAVKEQHLNPAGTPQIEEINDKNEDKLEYVASFEIYPQITLADLSSVEVEKRIVAISDDDVQKMIDKLCDQLADWQSVDRKVQSGDRVTVDFARLLENEKAKREEQKDIQLIVGGKGVLPGLSEALIGKTKGSQIEVDLTYPQDWAEKAVAGMPVKLWVSISDVADKKVLTASDLAKKLHIENENFEKLKDHVRTSMQTELDEALRDDLKEKVLEVLLKKNPIEIPQALIVQEIEAIHRELTRAQNKKMPKEILEGEEITTQAKQRVELGLLLNEVIKTHALVADESRVKTMIEKMAARFPNSAQIVEIYYKNHELRHGVERMILLEQAIDVLLSEIQVKEKTASFDEVMNPAGD